MSSQHTPGPWITWKLAKDSDPQERLIVVTADGETEICGIVDKEADAYLLAASPAMLDMLEEIVGHCNVALISNAHGMEIKLAHIRQRAQEIIRQAAPE